MRIAVCCKEGLFRDALASLIDHHGSHQVVSIENNARALINSAKEERAQLLVVDAHGLDEREMQFLLGAKAFGDFGIVLITPDDQTEEFDDGAVDRQVSRTGTADDLFEAIQEMGGRVRITAPSVHEGRRSYGRRNGDLTKREFEVAQLVSKGMSNRRIAQVTGLREQSIKNLVSVIMRKLHCENRVQVALRLTQGGPLQESPK